MKKRWWFTEYAKQMPVRWTWRVLNGDGTIDQQSSEFDSYGAAVRDALGNGFRPSRDHWAVETTVAVTHFERGAESVIILKGDRDPLIAPRATLRARRHPERKVRVPEVEQP